VERIAQPDSDKETSDETDGSAESIAEVGLESPIETRDEGMLAVVETENGEPAPPETPVVDGVDRPSGSEDSGGL
jgi:hypothetical protein